MKHSEVKQHHRAAPFHPKAATVNEFKVDHLHHLHHKIIPAVKKKKKVGGQMLCNNDP